MMKTFSLIALTLLFSLTAFAQASSDEAGPGAPALPVLSPQSDDDEPYRLKRGDNEFGGWGGVSFKATTMFEGLTEAEAADRKFFLAAFRYGRTLAANDSVALQYTLDAIPVTVATGVITSRTTVAGVTTFQRETAYGAGITPLGFQLDFANGRKIHPFVHVNAGFLGFTKEVPIEDSGKFAFTLEGGGGVRVFTSSRGAVTLGVRFHHISNGNRSGANRGLNQFIFYAGFSVFK
jgi:Lipid A 3-O-deacylase (PagL)